MTDDLRATLRNLVTSISGDDNAKFFPEKYIEHIDRAYRDAGYKCYPDISQHQLAQGGYMLGQEWLERFEKEMNESTNAPESKAWEAAKRAAGIKEIEK